MENSYIQEMQQANKQLYTQTNYKERISVTNINW